MKNVNVRSHFRFKPGLDRGTKVLVTQNDWQHATLKMLNYCNRVVTVLWRLLLGLAVKFVLYITLFKSSEEGTFCQLRSDVSKVSPSKGIMRAEQKGAGICSSV